jgi:hypothetical protein
LARRGERVGLAVDQALEVLARHRDQRARLLGLGRPAAQLDRVAHFAARLEGRQQARLAVLQRRGDGTVLAQRALEQLVVARRDRRMAFGGHVGDRERLGAGDSLDARGARG